MLKRYIITGAPGTGKTSLINALRDQGMCCFEEVSRRIIIQQQQHQGNKTPWQDVSGFTSLVYQKTVQELKTPLITDAFVDRGLADNMAYLKLKEQPVHSMFKQFNYHKYYHKMVFMLPPWEAIYKEDPQRLQSFKEAQALHLLLQQEYRALGFMVKMIPKTTINNRLNFMISIIKKIPLSSHPISGFLCEQKLKGNLV